MKVLSLQWRITLMTVLLIGVTCVSMNLLLCSSGVYYMDSIADSLQDYDHIAVEGGETAGFDPQLIPPGEGLTIVVSGAQARFRTTNWYITAAIALLGGVLAYFVSGHALRPLRRFAQQTEQVETSNLSEIRLDEETLPELRSLTHALNEMLERLSRGFDAQRQFVGNAAHELRTPLTAILGGARLLWQSKLSEGQQSELLDMMAREAARLSTMDERLLLLTRLGHERPEWTTFDSRAMAEEALRVFDGVRLEGEGAAFVGERELTILLLRNLVVNAQRAGGETPVCVTLHPDGFDVADCGCGMTEEQLAHAFEPFYKADRARTRGAGGAGLGLSLCRKIARLHRGDVRIESEIGKGTRVCYRFDTSL